MKTKLASVRFNGADFTVGDRVVTTLPMWPYFLIGDKGRIASIDNLGIRVQFYKKSPGFCRPGFWYATPKMLSKLPKK